MFSFSINKELQLHSFNARTCHNYKFLCVNFNSSTSVRISFELEQKEKKELKSIMGRVHTESNDALQ